MDQVQKNRHRDGLTVRQWIVLTVVFVLGIGGTFVLREIVPPASAQAAAVQSGTFHAK